MAANPKTISCIEVDSLERIFFAAEVSTVLPRVIDLHRLALKIMLHYLIDIVIFCRVKMTEANIGRML